MRRGVFYVAFGWPYLLLALESAKSIRRTNPGLPIAVATNPRFFHALGNPQRQTVDHWLEIDLEPEQNRLVKTSADVYSPFEQTLMLDADTFVVASVLPMFDWLSRFDVALKLNEARLGSAGNIEKGRSPVLDGSVTVDDLPHWNGAVCLFRKSRASREFFATWAQRFELWESPYDQVSLVDAVFLSSARVLSFDYRWNSPMKSFRNAKKGADAVIVHYGSDIPNEILHGVRRAASSLDGERDQALEDVNEFIATRERARLAKNRFLESAKRPHTTEAHTKARSKSLSALALFRYAQSRLRRTGR